MNNEEFIDYIEYLFVNNLTLDNNCNEIDKSLVLKKDEEDE